MDNKNMDKFYQRATDILQTAEDTPRIQLITGSLEDCSLSAVSVAPCTESQTSCFAVIHSSFRVDFRTSAEMQKQHSDMIVRRRYFKQKMTYMGLIACHSKHSIKFYQSSL